MNFITIKSSHNQLDFVVLQSRLESEGVECRLKNEFTTQVLNHIPAFEVELQVSENDLPKVKGIMIEIGEWEGENKKAVCPSCGSGKIKLKLGFVKRIYLYSSMIFSALFMTNLPMDKFLINAKFHCPECGNDF